MKFLNKNIVTIIPVSNMINNIKNGVMMTMPSKPLFLLITCDLDLSSGEIFICFCEETDFVLDSFDNVKAINLI